MAYNERDLNQDLDQTNLYEEDLYETDTFRERLDDSMDDEALADDPTMTDSDMALDNPMVDETDEFNETLDPAANPHIEDQLADDTLKDEAEADYTDPAAVDADAAPTSDK